MTDPVEIRIALVMNGGVSLAVWMGGVTHEIDLLRRASAGMAPPESPDERVVYDAWADLCRRLNVTVTVDVVAGSSAGGLNGVLLATGIARGAPLTQLRRTWEDTAQLAPQRLLWPSEHRTAPSVLNGSFFQKEVERIVAGIGAASSQDARDVTLFVTATAVGDQSRQVTDSSGVAFTVPDHRCLYRLSRQPKRVFRPTATSEVGAGVPDDVLSLFPEGSAPDPFQNSAVLARAARASASFPAAFAPVPERTEGRPGDPPGLESYRVVGSDGAWLMDGGVLDNAPFGPVLEEIARRPVDKPWSRALVYVVPSVAGSRAGRASTSEPDWQQVTLNAVFLPREVDLRSDIEGLRQMLAASERWGGGRQRLFAELRQADDATRASYRQAAAQLFSSYRRSRINGGITDALQQWSERDPQAPVTLRPPQDVNEDTRPVGWVPGTEQDLDRHDPWRWGTAVADRALRLMLRDMASAANHPHLTAEQRETVLTCLSTRLECVAALRDSLGLRIRQGAPTSPDDVTAVTAVNVVNQAVADLHVETILAALVRQGAEAYVRAAHCESRAPDERGRGAAADGRTEGEGASPDDAAPDEMAPDEVAPDELAAVVTDALVTEVLTGAFTAEQAFSRPVAFEFFRFGPDVASPLFSVPDPDDPDRELAPGPWKLWGTQLGHFAAFGRNEWRDNDWLWGRLDGAAHLVRLLHSRAPAAGTDHLEDVAALQRAILASQGDEARQQVAAALQAMPRLTFRGVLRDWARDAEGRQSLADSLDSVLRTLRNRDNGSNKVVASLGELATILVGSSIPDELQDEWHEEAKKALSRIFRLRHKLERYLFDEQPARRG